MTFSYSGSGDPEAKQEYKLMEKGKVYQFAITNAEEGRSKANNQMLVLDLDPTDPEFSSRTFKYYIVVNDFWENNIAKLRASAGKGYGNSATFEAHQVVGWLIFAQMKHEEYIKRDGTKGIGEKVSFIVVPKTEQAPAPAQQLPVAPQYTDPVATEAVPF